jgi:hypothetical protein
MGGFALLRAAIPSAEKAEEKLRIGEVPGLFPRISNPLKVKTLKPRKEPAILRSNNSSCKPSNRSV